MISVVVPFFNEQSIIRSAIEKMIGNLQNLKEPWELLLVNDGSIDDSQKIAKNLERTYPNLRVVGYPVNRGRGFALRTGISLAKGNIIVTTEIDCSWGDSIVSDIINALNKNPSADFVIASTHFPGGGYKDIHIYRIFISKIGNLILRCLYGGGVTMYTGMTRGYRRQAIENVPLTEDGKEFHLEVIHKLLLLGRRFIEIPATLTWVNLKKEGPKRKSSSKMRKIARSHMIFGVSTQPFRYLLILGFTFFILSLAFLLWGGINFFCVQPSIFLAILGSLFFLIFCFCVSVSLLTYQNSTLHKEVINLFLEYKK